MSNIFVNGLTLENPETGDPVKLTPTMIREVICQINIQNGRDLIENYTSNEYDDELCKKVSEKLEKILSDDSGDAEYRACISVLGEHFDEQLYTWDELYERADGTGCGDPELKAKDYARTFFEDVILKNTGCDINACECPEQEIEDCIAEHGEAYFTEDGEFVKGPEFYIL